MAQKSKCPIIIIAIIALLIGYIPVIAESDTIGKPVKPTLVTNQIEIQFESDVNSDRLLNKSNAFKVGIPNLDQALEKYHIKHAEKMFPWRKGDDARSGTDDMSKFQILTLPENSDIFAIIDDLKKNPYVRTVSAVWAMPLYEVTPDDFRFGSQWGLITVGAKDAWEIEKGSDTAIVAVVDVGVLYTHPDLEDNIWVNPGEDLDGDGVVFDLDDVNGVDDDGNGVVDDLIGYDFFTGVSNDPWPGEDVDTPDYDPKDFNGHGTHVAGIASSVTDNSIYGAGLAGGWGGGNGPYRGPRIMCIRVGGSYKLPSDPTQETGFVNTTNCAQGVDYAANMGATVINCSWGFSQVSAAMKAAGTKCNDSGVVVVHAAGNENQYSPSGGYLDDLILGTPPQEVALSVAATEPGDYRSNFSNYGEYVDVCAPGDNIYSTYSNHYGPSEAWIAGTSMAAPFVSGLAALIKSHMPQYSKVEINALIKDNAVNIDGINPGFEGWLGAGRIDAYATLANLPTAAFSAGPVLLGKVPLTVDFADLSPNNPFSWAWDFGDGGSSFDQNPSHIYQGPGLYSVALNVEEPKGSTTETLKNLVMVTADTLYFDSLVIPTSETDRQVTLPVYLTNNFLGQAIKVAFQIKMNGADVGDNLIYLADSISLEGCRTEFFEKANFSTYYKGGNIYSITLLSDISGGSHYLQPGSGPIMKLLLNVDYSVPAGTIFTFDTLRLSGDPARVISPYGEYKPEFFNGMVDVELCGDLNKDSYVNILDVIYLITYKYKNGPPPVPVMAADYYQDGVINIFDVVALINYKYKDGPDICGP